MLFFHILPNRKINTVCPQFCYFSTSPFVWTRIYGRTLIKAIIIICSSQMPTTYFAYRQHGRSSICCTLRYTLSPPHGYLNAGPHSDTGKKSTWQGSLIQVEFLDAFNVWHTKWTEGCSKNESSNPSSWKKCTFSGRDHMKKCTSSRKKCTSSRWLFQKRKFSGKKCTHTIISC